jgi:hypothetical protein
MRYNQVFTKMPETLLQHFARQEWALPFLKQAEDYVDLLSSKEMMKELSNRLSKLERWTLQLIVVKIGCEMFTIEMLEKQAASFRSGAEVRVAISGLRRFGILIAFRKSWGELLYALPVDGFSIWQALLLPKPETEIQEQLPLLESIEVSPSGSRGLAQELFVLAVYTAHHDLSLTTKGTIHKKQLQKLKDQLRLLPMEWNGSYLTCGSSEPYEFSFAVLLDIALRLGILRFEANMLVIETKAWGEWLRFTFEQQQIRLYGLWKELYVDAPLWLQHGTALIDRLPRGEWCSLAELMDWFTLHQIQLSPLQPQELKEALYHQWMIPLHAYRWLDVALDSRGEVWFCWLIDTHASCKQVEEPNMEANLSFYVQPDFELVLPPTIPPYLEWEVAAFADPISSDEVRVYQISKETFHRALESGKSADEIVGFLECSAIYRMPSGVTSALTEWGEQYGKLQFADVTLLRVRSKEIAEVIISSEKCRPFILSALNAADFIVKKEQIPQFTQLLEQLGYCPQLLLAHEANHASQQLKLPDTDSSTAPKNQDKNSRKGLFDLRDTYSMYELAPSLTEVEDHYPNLQDIPKLWLKEYREYHGSTRKDMIRQAIEWKSYLKIRKEGVDRRILPYKLQEDRSGWTLIGMENRQEIILQSEDWKEMKLLLPGINDQ